MSQDSQTKRKVGRPSKYKPEYCQALIEHCKVGKTFRSFCTKIGITPDTLYGWVRKYSEFSDAKKIAHEHAIDYHWSKLDRSSSDRDYNPTPIIYALKCLGQADDKELRELQKRKLELEIKRLEQLEGDSDTLKEIPAEALRKANEILRPHLAG